MDDYSRFTWTLFLRTKDETCEVFVAFVKKIQVKMESRVVCIRSDHGIEFDNIKFDEFYNENSITHNFSASRTPQQNGVVERKNITLEKMARTMMIDNGLAKSFWAEATNTACYLVNRYMIRSILNKTPYELLNGRKPKLTYLRTFDANAMFSTMEMISLSAEKDQDGEPLLVPGEVTNMTNGKADMMSQVKEPNKDNVASSSKNQSLQLKSLKPKKEWMMQFRELHCGLHGSHQNSDRLCFSYGIYFVPNGCQKCIFNGLLKEEVYVKQPPGFECHEHPEYVFKLDKALNGLKQAPRAWYERLSKFLLENGFKRGKIDNIVSLKK
ncbi:uncharacterized protein [Nicotiana sylvestris]|uniref:uncharacterized protein n=1 Tax=Nicotiana sylvestris TaxID=4096 RepID=UPI00388CE9C3